MKKIAMLAIMVLVLAVAGTAFCGMVGLKITLPSDAMGVADKGEAALMAKMQIRGDWLNLKAWLDDACKGDEEILETNYPVITKGTRVEVVEEPVHDVMRIRVPDGSLWYIWVSDYK